MYGISVDGKDFFQIWREAVGLLGLCAAILLFRIFNKWLYGVGNDRYQQVKDLMQGAIYCRLGEIPYAYKHFAETQGVSVLRVTDELD